MKKKNLVATLAIIAVSAIPLMAQQQFGTYNFDENLAKGIKASVEQEVNTQQTKQTRQINEAKYQTLTNDYNRFIELMKNRTLVNKSKEVAGHMIWMTIDDLAQSILNLPQPARNAYTSLIKDMDFRFAYQHNKKVKLEDLFNLAKSLKPITTLGNTSIEKLLAEDLPYTVVSAWEKNQYDEQFLDLVNTTRDELNNTITNKLNNELDNVSKVQSQINTYYKNKSEKYKAQVIWMAIDDLAQVILQLSEEEQAEVCNRLMAPSSAINLQGLYDFSKDYVYTDNSAMDKVMNKYAKNSNTNVQATATQKDKEGSWWKGIIETFQHEK